jgi:hypothetical protein
MAPWKFGLCAAGCKRSGERRDLTQQENLDEMAYV